MLQKDLIFAKNVVNNKICAENFNFGKLNNFESCCDLIKMEALNV